MLAAAALAVSLLAGCGDDPKGDTDGSAATDVEAVPLGLTAPTYALAGRDGLRLRAGDVRRTLPDHGTAEWLAGGRALLMRGALVRGIWDPATDEVTEVRLDDPNRSVTQVSLVEPGRGPGAPYQLVAYDLDGAEQWRVDLPEAEADVEGTEDADDVERMYGSAHTIDGATFLRWYDNSELEEHDDYGVLRVGPDGEGAEQVLTDVPVIALWLAADGSALLATRRVSGDPCGGCQVTQQLVEIDPADGSVVATHDLPVEYDDEWDVREVDKVGSRIAVRFEETVFGEPDQDGDWDQTLEQRGTWVLEGGDWSMVEGSDVEVSWWQGPDDRVVATPLAKEDDDFNLGDEFAYWWEHEGERTRLPGMTFTQRGRRYYETSVPGQLLPPA